MLLHAIVVGMLSQQVNWSSFPKFVNQRIAVAGNAAQFKIGLQEQIAAFVRTYPKTDADDSYLRKFFMVENSSLICFCIKEVDAIFVARPVQGKYRIEPVELIKDGDRFAPEHGVISSGRLIASGQEHYESNYKSPAAASYRFDKGRWRLAQFQSTNFEGGVDPFVARNSKWTSGATGRRYPKYISVPHSGAEVLMKRTFAAQNGRLLKSPELVVPCEMKTMDDLIHAIQTKNWKTVRSLCSTSKSASEIIALSLHAKKERWRPVDSRFGKSLSCQIPGTEKMATVERVGKDWKLTKIEPVKY